MEATGLLATPEAGALSAGRALARRHARSPGDPCSGFGDRLANEIERAADEHDAVASGPFAPPVERFGRGFRDFRFTLELLCEVSRRRRSVPSDAGEDHGSTDPADQREHRGEIFVTHRPEDDHHRTALRQLLNRSQRSLQAGGVVRAVDEHDRIPIDDFEATGPARAGQSIAQRAIRDIPSTRAQGIDRGDGESGIVRLVETEQRDAQVAVGAGRRGDGRLDASPLLVDRVDYDLLAEAQQRDLPVASLRLDDGERRWLRGGDRHAARLEDACLFRRYRLEGRAEILGVVEGDVRDYADAEVEDVGGVEPPAQAHLADEKIDAGTRKVVERCAGEDLELGGRAERRRNLTNGGLELRQQSREVDLGDWPLVD